MERMDLNMRCPRCKSENVTVTTEQVSGTSKTRRTGCLWGLIRLILIVFTFGLWLLIGKMLETSKMKYKNQTVGICQGCGYKWKV